MKGTLQSKTIGRWFAILVVALVGGCGPSGLELFPVEGQVKLDGRPLAEAGVMFLPVDKGPSAMGTTDSEGRFELMTVNAVGAPRGSYKVTIAKRKYVPPKPGQPAPPGGLVAEWYSPRQFANPETSGLTADVGDGTNDFQFELSSAPDK
jgi:hypothetical protein